MHHAFKLPELVVQRRERTLSVAAKVVVNGLHVVLGSLELASELNEFLTESGIGNHTLVDAGCNS